VLTRHRKVPDPLSDEWPAVSQHRYSTTLPPRTWPSGGVRFRCSLARLATDLKPQEVWEAVHDGLVEAEEDLSDGDLVIVMRLFAPDSRGRNLAALIKPAVDGVQCSLLGYDGERLDAVVRRVEETARRPELARDRLQTTGPLGHQHFVYLRGDGLQWSPTDDRLVRIELEFGQDHEAGLEGWVGRG